jgi:hypothetical protein
VTWRLYLQARGTAAYVLLWLLALGLVIVFLPVVVVLPVQLLWGQPTRWTPLWELLPCLLAATAGALIAPRMASWERLGRRGLQARAAATATMAIIAPSIIPVLAHYGLPADARWLDIAFNTAAIGAASVLLVALLSPLYGTLVSLGLYLGLILFQHAAPQLALHVPFSGIIGNLEPHVWETVALAAVAVAFWTLTLGRSRLAALLVRNEE